MSKSEIAIQNALKDIEMADQHMLLASQLYHKAHKALAGVSTPSSKKTKKSALTAEQRASFKANMYKTMFKPTRYEPESNSAIA